MKAMVAPDEADALAGLREHEAALDRRLDAARTEAEALLAGARGEAQRVRDVEGELSREIASLRADAQREREAAVAALNEETARRIAALHDGAVRNRERALAWILSRVTRDGAP